MEELLYISTFEANSVSFDGGDSFLDGTLVRYQTTTYPKNIIQHSKILITVHLPHKNFFKVHWYISIPAWRNIPNVYHREAKKVGLIILEDLFDAGS